MALRAEHITVELGGKEVLRDVSHTFRKGVRTAILGPNGAGKSTFLRAIAGLQKIRTGTIYLDDTDIHDLPRHILAQRMAILSQGLFAPADVDVRSLVDYGRSPYRRWYRPEDKERDKSAVEKAITACQLEAMADRPVASLSGGERQRAWLAMALAQEPEILLLDEPTTYLDIAHQLEVMEIIARLHRDCALTVIMVLHDIQHAAAYADEVVCIKDQGLYQAGPPSEVLTIDTLRTIYGVEVEPFTNARGDTILAPIGLLR
ncbi:ABC transporter ATP-binding protein [Selenomonas sp. TAMA-11512]|uniref:ABC transporter ATP-binding protein n=1 Tax=Selenomonas sp. TAMA-11512 TaxID=3095337 RepID=UPI00308B08BF|nr:ABC transporter ATP-binding protein [Selenomonas sp. TAMA-11512]